MFVESKNIDLCFFARAIRNNSATLFMNIHHQNVCFCFGVSKQFLQYERHIRHQIDGVIPHNDYPGDLEVNDFIRGDINGGLCHFCLLAPGRGDENHTFILLVNRRCCLPTNTMGGCAHQRSPFCPVSPDASTWP